MYNIKIIRNLIRFILLSSERCEARGGVEPQLLTERSELRGSVMRLAWPAIVEIYFILWWA